MGIVNFAYQKTPKSIGGFEIDAFLSERYSFSNSVTEIPVEDGSVINDHVTEGVDEISVSAFIGKAKFEVWEGDIPESEDNLPAEDPKARIKQSYFELLRLFRNKQPVTVVMGLDTFDNMIITSFNIDREAANGADLPFEMSFKKLRIIKSETATISASGSGAGGDQAAGTANAGTVSTSQPKREPDFVQQRFIERGEQSGWKNPTREVYLEECQRNGWMP
jgi:hypothetical protein